MKTRGEKPVAPYGHTLTMIDDITALLFGGDNNDETYLLDLTTWASFFYCFYKYHKIVI